MRITDVKIREWVTKCVSEGNIKESTAVKRFREFNKIRKALAGGTVLIEYGDSRKGKRNKNAKKKKNRKNKTKWVCATWVGHEELMNQRWDSKFLRVWDANKGCERNIPKWGKMKLTVNGIIDN